MSQNNQQEELVRGLMQDVVGDDAIQAPTDEIVETIENVLRQYNLSTDLSFVEKIAKMKFNGNSNESIDIAEMPKELKDASFLPVNTIADIALRQDLDLIISQIPEWFSAVKITCDAICEADIADGKLSRSILFDKSSLSETEISSIMSKIENVEDKLELDSIIKNHVVFNTLQYGEGYIYAIPYAKVFSDLYRYRLNSATDNKSSVANMFETSSALNGYGYGESSKVEISLNDTIINDSSTPRKHKQKPGKQSSQHNNLGVWTESEIIEINPRYHSKPDDSENSVKEHQEYDEAFEALLTDISKNIRYISEDIALPVIEESAHDLRCVYETKYQDREQYVNEMHTIFEQVMGTSSIGNEFERIKGIYIKILPATKLIPVRVDRHIIGYYYISDLTRPEESGERKNSGLGGYTLRSPSVGYDSFSPDRMFCEKLASKIINNFNLKFMRDNTALHQQIVAILQTHKFNEAMMRFVFIPAEHVCQCAVNKDGVGKGHSMLEPGLVTARMYMFLKLYSVLYQINNSQIRVYNLNMSGIDKNYRQLVQETMRKFAARRVTANDIFNYRSSMTKVSGGSELIMPLGAGDKPPITFDHIPAAESPINNDLLENLKNEAINSTSVPSAMVQGAMSELDFAKEVELANTRFNSMVSSYKIDLNRDITKLYRRILRWETDIDQELLAELKFMFKSASAKTLSVTAEMISNFESLAEMASKLFLTSAEQKPKDGEETSEIVREFKKILLGEVMPQIDIEKYNEFANQARNKHNKKRLESTNKAENLLGDQAQQDEGLV